MRLHEITKDTFKKKLKYPMELVNSIQQEVDEIMEGFRTNGSITATVDTDYGDDFVSWTFEIRFNADWPNDLMFEIIDARSKAYRDLPNVSLSTHMLNSEKGYALVGLQLDV